MTGNGPGVYKLGRSVRYRLDEGMTWVEARRKAHTSQGAHVSRTRAPIEDTRAKPGPNYVSGTESIGREDVACDVLAPNLAPDRAHLSEDMEDLQSMADRSKVHELLRAERDDMLRKQIAGAGEESWGDRVGRGSAAGPDRTFVGGAANDSNAPRTPALRACRKCRQAGKGWRFECSFILMAALTSLIEMSALSIPKQRPESLNRNALVIISLPDFSKLATTDRAGWYKELDTIWLAFHRFKRQDARTETATDK